MERTIWMRVGVTLKGTEEEIEALFEDGEIGNEALKKLLSCGQYVFSGDSYIPEDCIEDYNRNFGTEHESGYYEYNI